MTGVREYSRTEHEDKLRRVEQEVERMLVHLDPTGPRSGTNDTPQRVAKMFLDELCAGYHINASELLTQFDSEGYGGMVALRDIPVTSLCEHHLVPFSGHAHVGYFPDGKVVGLSKIARVVNAYGRRLQIQERLTQQICNTIEACLEPRGVIVIIEAEHFCMTIRGVQAPGTKTLTSAVTGLFEDNSEGEKEEFFALIGKG